MLPARNYVQTLLSALLFAGLLSACGSQPPSTLQPTAASQPTATAQPTSACQ